MPTIQTKSALSVDELLNKAEQLSLTELEQLISRVIALRAKRRAPYLPEKETQLLLKINRGLPPEVQKRYDVLNTRRREEKLTSDEHQELLHITGQIEKMNAERVQYLAELARLRGISLTALMEELDIRPPAYE